MLEWFLFSVQARALSSRLKIEKYFCACCMTIEQQFMMFVCWFFVCANTNPTPHSLLASVKSCVGRSLLQGFSCRFWDMLCLINLNSVSSSCVQVRFQCLFSCVMSLRCFVCSVMVLLCNIKIMAESCLSCVIISRPSVLT